MSVAQEKNFHYYLNCYYTMMEQQEEIFDKLRLADVMQGAKMNNFKSIVVATGRLKKQAEDVLELANKYSKYELDLKAMHSQIVGMVEGMKYHLKLFHPEAWANYEKEGFEL